MLPLPLENLTNYGLGLIFLEGMAVGAAAVLFAWFYVELRVGKNCKCEKDKKE